MVDDMKTEMRPVERLGSMPMTWRASVQEVAANPSAGRGASPKATKLETYGNVGLAVLGLSLFVHFKADHPTIPPAIRSQRDGVASAPSWSKPLATSTTSSAGGATVIDFGRCQRIGR